LTPSSVCGLEPVKSYVRVSPSLIAVSSTFAFRVGHVDVLADAPVAVGELGEPVPYELLRLTDQLLGNRLDDVDAVVGVELAEPLLRDVVRLDDAS